jgi:LmbE family N-acetylglucosaminyl deacetylase
VVLTSSNLNKKAGRVLVLAAHPDDETLGCGATIARLADEGYLIDLLTFTDGCGAREVSKNRNKKLKKVKKILGLNSYFSSNFPDNKMDTAPLLDVCKYIEKNVNFVPDIIFTHHKDCLNIDHRIVYQATLTCFRPQVGNKTKIYSYYVPSSTDYSPFSNFDGETYFDVGKYKDKKIKCLKKCYAEEMRDYPHSRSYQNVENLMKVWGSEVGIHYAEKFKLIREIL